MHINEPWTASIYNQLGKFSIAEGGKLSVDECVIRSDCNVVIRKNAELKIGKNVLINNNTQIFVDKKIVVGDDVIISTDVIVRDCDVHEINGKINKNPIIIHNNVWICARVIILPGVEIGEGSVVTAGSVVTHDVPSFCLVAGVPAKIVKENIHWKG